MTGDRTPTGDLREHFAGLADSECGEHRTVGARAWCYRDGEWCYPDAPCRGCELPALRVRAEEAERERDDYRQRFANQMTAATELTTTLREAERKLQQALEAIADERRGRLAAEAAVRRAREMAENEEERVARGFGYQFGGRPFPASILTRDVLAALDAEQPKESP